MFSTLSLPRVYRSFAEIELIDNILYLMNMKQPEDNWTPNMWTKSKKSRVQIQEISVWDERAKGEPSEATFSGTREEQTIGKLRGVCSPRAPKPRAGRSQHRDCGGHMLERGRRGQIGYSWAKFEGFQKLGRVCTWGGKQWKIHYTTLTR